MFIKLYNKYYSVIIDILTLYKHSLYTLAYVPLLQLPQTGDTAHSLPSTGFRLKQKKSHVTVAQESSSKQSSFSEGGSISCCS